MLNRFAGWIRRLTSPKRDLVREMEELFEEGTAEGVLNEEEEDMLLSVLSLRDTRVREVMVPRTEMVCIEAQEPLQTVAQTMVREGHSRVPVYQGDVDHVLGFVTARDVLRFSPSPEPGPPVRELMRPAYFVPETMTLAALLREFRRRRIHLAIAVDEYGGVSGLATLEDVLEEIVGDIHDEYDEEEGEIREAGDGLCVDARTEIEKLEERLGVEFGEELDCETVGGLVFQVLGHVPREGETFLYRGLEVTVLDADKRRVREVKIRKVSSTVPDGATSKDTPPP
jgi:CBS domain containing-hemolysin-like protein